MSKEFLEAIQSGQTEKAQALLESDPSLSEVRSEQGVSALLLALYYGRQPIADLLLASGVRLDIYEASATGRTDWLRELAESSPQSVRSYSPDGFTPLHLASFFGADDAAALLLELGADPNAEARNPMKVRPLHSCLAGRNPRARAAIARALLAAGADANAPQQSGYTALHAAAQHGDLPLARLLVQHKADRQQSSDDGKTALDFAREHDQQEMVRWLEG